MTKMEVRKSPPTRPRKSDIVRFRLDPSTRQHFRELAARNNVTMSALLHDAVVRFLASNR